jgi:hypothetical protein
MNDANRTNPKPCAATPPIEDFTENGIAGYTSGEIT